MRWQAGRRRARFAASFLIFWRRSARERHCRNDVRFAPALRASTIAPCSPTLERVRSTVPRLVVDIGGRSTEMIRGRGTRPRQAESFQVGSVSLSMKYFPERRFTEKAFREAQVAAGAELEEALRQFAPKHWREALGA